jgi:hypothetical protein
MRRLRIAGCCLVAVFALAATVAAAGASAAEPAVFQCAKAAKVEKKYTGHYSSKKCEASSYHAEGGQKYELEEWNLKGKGGKSKAFKGKGGGANLEIIGVGGVTCTKNSDSGEITGPKTIGKVKVTFTGCEFQSKKCQGAEPATSKEGEIKTNNLVGEVGYINKAKKQVGGLFTPEAPNPYFTEFNCQELKFRVLGGVIGEVTSTINAFTKSVTLDFKESAGIQNPLSFEGGPVEKLLTEEGGKGGWPANEEEISKYQSGQSLETTNKGEELELKA